MSVEKTGNYTHDQVISQAEGRRQAAIAAANGNQEAVRLADIAFYETVVASSKAYNNSADFGQACEALDELNEPEGCVVANPGGLGTELQYRFDGITFGGASGTSWNQTTKVLTMSGGLDIEISSPTTVLPTLVQGVGAHTLINVNLDTYSSPTTAHGIRHVMGPGADRVGMFVEAGTYTSPEAPHVYVGSQSLCTAGSPDTAAHLSSVYAFSSYAKLYGNATGWFNLASQEIIVEAQAGTSVSRKWAAAFVLGPADAVQGTDYDTLIAISSNVAPATNYAKYGILFSDGNGAQPFGATSTAIGSIGSATLAYGVDLSSYTFTSAAFKSTGFSVDGLGTISAVDIRASRSGTAGVYYFGNGGSGNFLFFDGGQFNFSGGGIARSAPVTETNATHTLAQTTTHLICNRAGTITVTLPSPSTFNSREIFIKTIQPQTVVSASSNVVPSTSGTAGTAILPATDGAWAFLVSDGTNWVIMAANPLV